MVFQMADAITVAKDKGLVVPVVYNSNGYDSVETLRQIRGLVDIYLPDIKYLDNGLARRLSGVDDYADIVPGALGEMLDQVGHLKLDDDGIAVRGLLVRHLVLPDHLSNSRECLRALADLSPDTHISIMSQYSPRYRAGEFPGINRTLTAGEYDQAIDLALELGLENAFTQELESQEHCLPDFAQESPFNFA
jgi:putative pyruvate formate lyase activating enzyme